MPGYNMDETEAEVAEMFAPNGFIDVTQGTVEFDLAATMGRIAGEKQCKTVYARCKAPYNQIKEVVEEMTQNKA